MAEEKKSSNAATKLEEVEKKSSESVSAAEESSPNDYEVNVVGRPDNEDNGENNSSLAKKIPLFLAGLIIALIPVIFSTLTVLYPIHLAATGIGKIVQFFSTIKDKITSVFTDEYMASGEIPEELDKKLNENGVTVGVLVDGEFIKTRKIIASGPEYRIASNGGFFTVDASATDGEMRVSYKGKTYNAAELKKALETNNDLYDAFDSAIGGDSLFFYDRSGESTFADLGINRDPYHDFSSTGNDKEDQEQFEELFAKAVDYDPGSSSTGSNGSGGSEEEESEGELEDPDEFPADDDTEEEEDPNATSSPGEENLEAAEALAETYIRTVANGTKSTEGKEAATKKAAALINAAISANEPYQSARASAAILIGAEQAKAGEGGPINEMANYMTRVEETESDGGETELLPSASESVNLGAVVTDTEFDQAAAADYSRDRVSYKSEVEKESKDTTVSITSGFKKFISWIIGLFTGGDKADADVLVEKYKTDVAKALYMKVSKLMKGINLGERVTEGLSFLNTSLSKNAGATNASGEEAISVYNEYTKKLYDRKIAAERSTKSPFDVSSPYTFFGSLVNNVYEIGISDTSLFGKMASLTGLASKSLGNVFLGAYADSLSGTYISNNGDCPTVEAVSAKGDIYCNQIATYDVSKFSNGKTIITATLKDYAEGDFSERLKEFFEGADVEGGKIKEGSDLAEYIILGTGRASTPGVRDANVCQAIREGAIKITRYNFDGDSASDSCKGIDDETLRLATGEAFANTENNHDSWNDTYKYIQGYYLEVYARELTGYYADKENPIVAFKEAYYKKHPQDNSPEGILARRTGWSKADIIAGIEAIEYLAYLENYDPSSRLAFFETPEKVEITIEEKLIPTDTRLAAADKIVFDEKRNRVVLI